MTHVRHKEDDHQNWVAPDGTVWFFYKPLKLWTGWEPHEDGSWYLGPEEFRRSYPTAPPWDQECI